MLNEDESRAVLLVFANKQDLPNATNDSEITDKLGLYSLRQRHWYIENTCAAAVYSYGLAMEEDPPDAAQCITLQRQDARATLQTQKHDGQAGGSMREVALWTNSAEATTFFTNKEVQHNVDCLSSPRSDQEFLQFPWDPGSNLQHRLGGKPSLRVGGMSGIICAMGRHQAMGRVMLELRVDDLLDTDGCTWQAELGNFVVILLHTPAMVHKLVPEAHAGNGGAQRQEHGPGGCVSTTRAWKITAAA
jgi:hypothetical protein